MPSPYEAAEFGLPDAIRIRAVTPDSVASDLRDGRLVLPPGFSAALPRTLGEQTISFLVAETEAGEPRGQVGIRWRPPVNPALREHLPDAHSVGFFSVPEAYRSQGIGSALLRAVDIEADAHGSSRLHLNVRLANPAKRLYARTGWRDWGFGELIVTEWKRTQRGHMQRYHVRANVLVKDLAAN